MASAFVSRLPQPRKPRGLKRLKPRECTLARGQGERSEMQVSAMLSLRAGRPSPGLLASGGGCQSWVSLGLWPHLSNLCQSSRGLRSSS